MKYILLLAAVLIIGILILIKPNLIDLSRLRADASPLIPVGSSARFPKRVVGSWLASSPPIDGNFEWVYARMKSPDSPHVAPAADETGVYVGNASSWFYAFRPDQTLKWKFRIECAHDGIASPAILSHGRVYFGGTNGTLYCLSKESGEVIWSATLPGDEFRRGLNVKDDLLSFSDLKIDLRDGRIHSISE